MTRRNRKYRKTPTRVLGDTPSNVVGRGGNFQSKFAETTAISDKQTKKLKEKGAEQPHQFQHPSGSKKRRSIVTLMWKISSVSFFIPLNDEDQSEVPAETIIDWSNLLFYRCNKPTMLSYLPNAHAQRMYFFKPTVLPELKLKCRTLSESSTDRNDLIICYQNDDNTYDNRRDCKPVNSKKCALRKSDVIPECKNSPPKQKSRDKKRVSFVDDSQLATVHQIVAWDYAYRTARVSPWMTVARDAKRFEHRVRSLESILSPILNPEHRARIWEERDFTGK